MKVTLHTQRKYPSQTYELFPQIFYPAMRSKLLEAEARSLLKSLIVQCTDGQKEKFCLMYCPGFSRGDMVDLRHVVDEMPSNNLDCALSQCEETIKKNGKAKP